jgi:hypothetical protein
MNLSQIATLKRVRDRLYDQYIAYKMLDQLIKQETRR